MAPKAPISWSDATLEYVYLLAFGSVLVTTKILGTIPIAFTTSIVIKYLSVVPATMPALITKSSEGDSAMSTYFLGVDPSATSTGLTLLGDENQCFTRLIKPKKLRDCQRLQYISTEIKDFISTKNIALCVYETPSYGSTHKEFILGEALGVIKLTLTELGIPLVGAAPTQLKKYLAGRGDASKAVMISKAVSLGCPVSQEDICDSYAAALLCKDLLLGPLLPTRTSREVRAVIHNKHPHLGEN